MKKTNDYKTDENFEMEQETIKDTASIILISNYINVFLKELEYGSYKVNLEEVALICIMLYEKYLEEKKEDETLGDFLIKNEKMIKINFLTNLNIEREDIGLVN